MAKAKITETLKVDFDTLFDTITDYESYPEFLEGCQSVELLSTKGSKKKVKYQVKMMKDVEYTLEHKEDRKKGTICWDLIEGNIMKKNSGLWTLQADGDDQTTVTYEIEIDFTIPVPSLIMSKLVKGSLPGMIRSFEKQAQKRAKKGKK
jgi:ribosome-associated toxin RatA of RatAB toxin-antitoxin module